MGNSDWETGAPARDPAPVFFLSSSQGFWGPLTPPSTLGPHPFPARRAPGPSLTSARFSLPALGLR